MGAFRVKLVLLLFALAFAVPTFAGTIDIDYSNSAAGGTFAVSGGNATGTGIQIGQLIVTNGTTSTSDAIVGGMLNFSTSADTLTISGAIPALSIASTTLSSGDFTSFTITPRKGGGYDFTATGDATTNAALLTALGLPSPQGPSSYDVFVITASTALKGGGFSVTSVDIGTTAMTPEPVSMLLMGTFLSLAGGLLSRKKRT